MSRNFHCTLPDCATCTTRDRSVFTQLTTTEVSTLSTAKGCRAYDKGEIIFHADQPPSGVYCVHQGTVKIYKVSRDGREQIVRLARAGDIIGYRAAVSGEKYRAFAAPVDKALLCRIPREAFHSLLANSFDLSSRIMSLLAHDLQAAEEKIVEIVQKPVRERLAETFLLLKESHGFEADKKTLGIKLTRIELANMVGTTPETISRVLSSFKKEQIINTRGRKLLITDYDALVDAANLED